MVNTWCELKMNAYSGAVEKNSICMTILSSQLFVLSSTKKSEVPH